MALPVKQKETGESKISNATSEWKYPASKRRALDMQDVGVRTSITKSLAGNLVNFMQSIGADNELPTDHAKQVQWLNHFHRQLAVNNPLWPEKMDFEFVYAAFANAVIYDRVTVKGHNIHAFISAFKDFIMSEGDKLDQDWIRKTTPKREALPEKTTITTREQELKEAGLVDMPPDKVQQQVLLLRKLYKTEKEALKGMPGSKSYAKRLFNTYKKYIKEGKLQAD